MEVESVRGKGSVTMHPVFLRLCGALTVAVRDTGTSDSVPIAAMTIAANGMRLFMMMLFLKE